MLKISTKELLAVLAQGQRKGLQSTEDGESTDGRPEKVFNGPECAKSIEYAIYVMDNKVEFSKLQDSEKDIVKSTYLSAYEVHNSH